MAWHAAHADLFGETNLLRIEVSIPAEEMRVLRAYRWNPTVSERDRPKVKVAVTERGTTYSNVALHLKGRFGTFRSIDDLPSFTLNFDKFAPGRKFHGLAKFSLNNSAQDPTCVHEKFCRELFSSAGVPAARSDHAVVSLNGRKLGLYVLTEGYDKEFLKRHFARADGNFYDPGHLEDVDHPLERDSGKGPDDHSDLKGLVSAAQEPDSDKRFELLAGMVEMESFISMVAMEVLLSHWDSYSMNRNNYRLYHNPDTGRFVFMPHGMDQVLGIDRPNLDLPVLPPIVGLVACALVTTRVGRERYVQRAGVLATNLFKPEELCRRVREIDAKIRAELQQPGHRWPLRSRQPNSFIKTSGNHKQDIEELCERIRKRAQYLQGAFGNDLLRMPLSPAFDANGVARLDGWRPKEFRDTNEANLSNVNSGTPVLRIRLANGAAAASWRLRVILEPGRYEFAGRAKLASADAGANPRVQLRISGRSGARHALTIEWAELRHAINVESVSQEVELVCELNGGPAAAWFDAQSLRLVRIRTSR